MNTVRVMILSWFDFELLPLFMIGWTATTDGSVGQDEGEPEGESKKNPMVMVSLNMDLNLLDNCDWRILHVYLLIDVHADDPLIICGIAERHWRRGYRSLTNG